MHNYLLTKTHLQKFNIITITVGVLIHIIATVPVEQPWTTWVYDSFESNTNYKINYKTQKKTKHKKTVRIFKACCARGKGRDT